MRSGFVFFTIPAVIAYQSYYNITISNLQVHCRNILGFFCPKDVNRQIFHFTYRTHPFPQNTSKNDFCHYFMIRQKIYCKLSRISCEYFVKFPLTKWDFSCIIKMITKCLQDLQFFLIFSLSNTTRDIFINIQGGSHAVFTHPHRRASSASTYRIHRHRTV